MPVCSGEGHSTSERMILCSLNARAEIGLDISAVGEESTLAGSRFLGVPDGLSSHHREDDGRCPPAGEAPSLAAKWHIFRAAVYMCSVCLPGWSYCPSLPGEVTF